MIFEYVTIVRDEPTLEDIELLVKRANRLGMKNRGVLKLCVERDNEDFCGHHYFFECGDLDECPY